MTARTLFVLCLGLLAMAACNRPTNRGRVVTLSSGNEGLRDDQAGAEAGGLSELVWRSDGSSPAIWSVRDSRDYFVPRVGLRFSLPPGYGYDAGLSPARHLVLEGPAVPQAIAGERLIGDRNLQIRGAAGAPIVVSLVEIPMEVEPASFCAWVSTNAHGQPAVSRDEAEHLAESTTRLCELRSAAVTTRVRGFLRAGWLLIFSQQLSEDGASAELDAVVRNVRAFEE